MDTLIFKCLTDLTQTAFLILLLIFATSCWGTNNLKINDKTEDASADKSPKETDKPTLGTDIIDAPIDNVLDTQNHETESAGKQETQISETEQNTSTHLPSATGTDTAVVLASDTDIETDTRLDTSVEDPSSSNDGTEWETEPIPPASLPVITSIEGDGSAKRIVDEQGVIDQLGNNIIEANNRFRSDWRVTGHNLDTVTACDLIRTSDDLRFDAINIDLENQGTLLIIHLPLDLVSGLFRLILHSQVGQTEALVYILRGEKGDNGNGAFCEENQCNISGEPRAIGNAGDTPEAETSCISRWGAEDMIGNYWEWAADWFSTGMPSDDEDLITHPWPRGYGDGLDVTFNLNGSVDDGSGDYVGGLPAASLRGGDWQSGTQGGIFSVSLNYAPTHAGDNISARCCRRR